MPTFQDSWAMGNGHSTVENDGNNLSSFLPISEEYLTNMIKRNNNKYSSVDNIPSKILRDIQTICKNQLLNIINCSLVEGIFPDALKITHVTPTIKDKKGDPNSLQNYRPIFEVSYVSKSIEKCAFEQLQQHLYDNNLNFTFQSAFKKDHSCETALVKIYHDVLENLGPNQTSSMLFLDFSSAFDTVNHELLLDKLEHDFKITDSALMWFKTYFQNRKFQVRINDKLSKPVELNYGVPQGSVLAPTMFSLYSQSIHTITDKYGLNIHLFADDVQIYSTGTDPELQKTLLQDCFNDIVDWAKANSLQLNNNKTKFMVIKTKYSPLNATSFNNFEMHEIVKNLGFIIDKSLNFNSQINQVCRKSFNLLRNLWRISSKIKDINLKIQIVKSCLIPHIDYCNCLYACLPQKQIKKLQRILNAAIRFIYNLRRSDEVSITSYAKKCHILPVYHRVNFKICILA